jgi:AcrR family transcriptional regulator
VTAAKTTARRGRPPLDPFQIEAARASLLAAAAAVYNRTGQDGPVQAILNQAGVSRATFYKLFPSKEALQTALLEISIKVMFRAIEDAVGRADAPVERIDAAIHTFLDFHALQPGVYRTLLAAALPPGTPLHEVRLRGLERFSALFAAEVERAGRAPVDPLIHQGLVAAAEGVSSHILRGGGRVDPNILDRARVALVRLIAATLGLEGTVLPPPPRPDDEAAGFDTEA